jgi:hypothetical protein
MKNRPEFRFLFIFISHSTLHSPLYPPPLPLLVSFTFKQQPEVKENGKFPFLVTKRKRKMELGSNREAENELPT